MNIQVHFDELGQIISVVQVPDVAADVPPAGVILPRQVRVFETRLSGADAKQPLIVLHTGYRLDLRKEKPRLVRIERPAKRKQAS